MNEQTKKKPQEEDSEIKLHNMSTANNNQGPMSPMSPASVTSSTPDMASGTTIMRIEQDSDDNLQALFDSVLKPGEKKILSILLSMRKLPKSFFQPPSHSRENSIDSALGCTTPTPTSAGNSAAGPTNASATAAPQQHLGLTNHRLTISHSRAHSSPATLQQTYAAGQKLVQQQQQQQQAAAQAAASGANGSSGGATAGPQTASTGAPLKAVHASQRSYDVVSAIQLQEELGDLPPGWEQARTAEGQIYYLK